MFNFDFTMPLINLSLFSPAEQTLLKGIIATQGKNKGRLRASKPKITYQIVDEDGRKLHRPTLETGGIAYLWRMVAFAISPVGKHHCLPFMADFDLPYRYGTNEYKELKGALDALADKVEATIRPEKRHGTNRWLHALHG
jgi:hypothetical protein